MNKKDIKKILLLVFLFIVIYIALNLVAFKLILD